MYNYTITYPLSAITSGIYDLNMSHSLRNSTFTSVPTPCRNRPYQPMSLSGIPPNISLFLLTVILSIEIATRAADHFTRLYYDAYDSATRDVNVPKFYRPSSSLTWNGKPYQGSEGVRSLIQNMPRTKHDVQCLDCHPIPGLQFQFFHLLFKRTTPLRESTAITSCDSFW